MRHPDSGEALELGKSTCFCMCDILPHPLRPPSSPSTLDILVFPLHTLTPAPPPAEPPQPPPAAAVGGNRGLIVKVVVKEHTLRRQGPGHLLKLALAWLRRKSWLHSTNCSTSLFAVGAWDTSQAGFGLIGAEIVA